MWSYIWDIVDDGVEEVLGVLKNDIGLDAISLATSYHSVDHLRPHTKGKRIFVSYDASVYFQPDEKLYKDTYIKPYINPIVGDGNPLSEISDQCDKIGLKLISWTVCIHNTRMGRTYPQAAQRNVFSDIYAAYPCLGNPAVQKYFKALLKDLTYNYNMYAIEVESLSFGGYGHFHAHQKLGFDLGAAGQFLLSLCFCDSCVQRGKTAGIDVDAIATEVKNRLLRSFEAGEPVKGNVDETIVEIKGMADYLKVREQTMTSLVQNLKNEIKSQLFFMSMGDVGINAKEIGKIADRVEVLCYTSSPDSIETSAKRTAERFGHSTGTVTVGLQAYPPASPDQQTLEENVRRAVQVDVEGFSFYNYGIMPQKCLGWVKSAVDIVKRET
jgi:hypothetical protein